MTGKLILAAVLLNLALTGLVGFAVVTSARHTSEHIIEHCN